MSKPKSPLDDEFDDALLADEEEEIRQQNSVKRHLRELLAASKHKKTRMGIIASLVILLLLIVIAIAVVSSNNNTKKKDRLPTGAEPSNTTTTLKTEQQFRDLVTTQSIEDFQQYYSSMPHLAGTEEDLLQATYTYQRWKEYGFESQFVNHSVYLSYPVSALVEIVYPPDKAFVAPLKEEPVPEDPTSSNPRAAPPFVGYSATGEVTAELVYANYGLQEDFELLEKNGISIAGKIVIVRYGKIFRGNKVKQAEDKGAVGVLIFSHPADDGFMRGTTYPNGPWRPESSVQRGSVWVGEGDPLTPGWASTENAPRLNISQLRDEKTMLGWPIPGIPVQPLSFRDAEPLLFNLGNKPVPDPSWSGGLQFLDMAGPGPVRVHMKVAQNATITPIWNVVAKFEGRVRDRLIIIGAHRDAWTMGSVDNLSGHSIMMEITRAFSRLRDSTGWIPNRSFLFCSWDAEEYALIGSTEFVEQYSSVLDEQAVIYFNLDVAVSGIQEFSAGGSPSVADIVREISKKIPIDTERGSIYDVWVTTNSDTKLERLASGSDFCGFQNYLGITSLDLRFADDKHNPVYHSNYDSFYWMSHFGDPGFSYHELIAQITGSLLIRFADIVILPFNHEEYAKELQGWVDSVIALSKVQTGYNAYVQIFQDFKVSVSKFKAAAVAINQEIASLDPKDIAKANSLNDRLMYAERGFLLAQGIPGRPWFRHCIYTPATLNSYGGNAFPSIVEPLMDQANKGSFTQWPEIIDQVRKVTQSINQAAKILQTGRPKLVK